MPSQYYLTSFKSLYISRFNFSADAPKVLGFLLIFKRLSVVAKKYSLRQAAKVLSLLKTYDLKSKGLGAYNMPLENYERNDFKNRFGLA